MNKNLILISLIGLILFSSVVLAESEDTTDNSGLDIEENTEIEEAGETVLSETETVVKPYIRTLFFSGTGIASNPNDAMDFYTVKVVGAKVALPDKNIIGRGILVLDDKKYRLTGLTVEGDTATADIYSYDENNSVQAGTLSLTKVAKPLVDVWAGTMTLDSKEYYFYLIAHKRMFKVQEIAEKAKNYCKLHPYDETCKSVAGYLCKENPEECKTKVYRYCEDHSDDSRCKEIIRSYCAGNLKDGRCREEVRAYCKENPDAEYCKDTAVDFCRNNPEDEKCQNVFTEYCKTHSKEARCRAAEIDFCRNDPSSEKCAPVIKQYCEFNQNSELCGTAQINYCEQNPDALKCKATATALCSLDRFKNTEDCSKITSAVRERVREITKTITANKVNNTAVNQVNE